MPFKRKDYLTSLPVEMTRFRSFYSSLILHVVLLLATVHSQDDQSGTLECFFLRGCQIMRLQNNIFK